MIDVDAFIDNLIDSNLYKLNDTVRARVDLRIPEIRAAVGDNGRLKICYDALHDEIQALLRGREHELDVEDEKWIRGIVDRDYGEALTTLLLVLDPSKDERAPTKEKIEASILKQLKPEQVTELRKLREPILLIVPDTNIERLQMAIDKPECQKKGSIVWQINAYVSDFFRDTIFQTAQYFGVQKGENIKKYRFAIVEGAQHFNETDDAELWNKGQIMSHGQRIDDFEAHYIGKGIESMNAPAYMMLMMRALRNGKPTDHISGSNHQFTLLAGSPKDAHVRDDKVAIGYWDPRSAHVCLTCENLGVDSSSRHSPRLRASMMGEV